MSVTAKSLSKTSARGDLIDSLVREHIGIIDTKLLRHERVWGRNCVQYDLPSNIPIPGLSKPDAQRILYSALIRAYEKRNFEVGLAILDEGSRLYIAWMTDLDAVEVEAMNALIRARRLGSRDEVIDFLAHGRAPAPHAASTARRGVAGAPEALTTADTRSMRSRGGMRSTAAPATAYLAAADARRTAATTDSRTATTATGVPVSAAEAAIISLSTT